MDAGRAGEPTVEGLYLHPQKGSAMEQNQTGKILMSWLLLFQAFLFQKEGVPSPAPQGKRRLTIVLQESQNTLSPRHCTGVDEEGEL